MHRNACIFTSVLSAGRGPLVYGFWRPVGTIVTIFQERNYQSLALCGSGLAAWRSRVVVSLNTIRQAASLEACFFHISPSEPTVFSKSDARFVSSTSLTASRRVRHSSAVSDCKQSSSAVLIRCLFAAGRYF
eukprot:Em0021g857a